MLPEDYQVTRSTDKIILSHQAGGMVVEHVFPEGKNRAVEEMKYREFKAKVADLVKHKVFGTGRGV